MEPQSESLRRDLQRYRFLLAHIADRRAAAALRELIAEAEARLGALEPPATRGLPVLLRLVL